MAAAWRDAGRTYNRLTSEYALVIDAAIGAAIAGIGIAASQSTAAAFAAVAIGASLTLRRRYPTPSYVAVFVFAALTGNQDAWGTFLGLLVAAGSLATYARYRWLAFLVLLASAITITAEFGGNLGFIPDGVVPFLILSSVWIAGSAIAKRQRRADESEERARRMIREQEQERQLALVAERARIARELHDVVTHSVSVMLVQTGAARTKLARDPEASKQALLAVEATGREALQELRGFLGVLDGNGAAPLELAPQPGLGDVETLLQRIGDAGLPAELAVLGERVALPPGVELAAYRVVQEALTNALKYAEHARTEVVLDYRDGGIAVEVMDEGPGTVAGSSGGRGLTGLRERVAACGGTFQAGRRPSGGFAVQAWLPVAVTHP